MSIVLRVNKGSALTYHEMDRNQSQFFYSSSLDPTGTKMRLFYTGSSALNETGLDFSPDRYQEIPFPSAPEINIPEAAAAGSNTQVQFNDNGLFGADNTFTYDKAKNAVGIGGGPIDGYKLGIRAGDGSHKAGIQLRGISTSLNSNTQRAQIDFARDAVVLGTIGTDTGENDLFITHRTVIDDAFGKINISFTNSTEDSISNTPSIVSTFTKTSDGRSRVGIGTINPHRPLSIAGSEGLGISVEGISTNESSIQPLFGDILSTTDDNGSFFIRPSSAPAGLLISSPNGIEGGNVVININTDNSQKESFNIVSTTQSDFSNSSGANTAMLASFGVDGKHSINTQRAPLTGLTVQGDISGSGNLYVGTIPEEENVGDVTVIGVDAVGKIHKSKAAPVPIGGIIMWSGAVDSLPSGFYLCNGENGTPDLRDRFIVGASNSSGTPTSTVSGSTALASGGSAGIDEVISSELTTLTLNQIPEHDHVNHNYLGGRFKHLAGWSRIGSESSNVGSNNTGWETVTGDDDSDGGTPEMLVDVSEGGTARLANSEIQAEGGGQGHGHFITLDLPTLPPFYALAFIMYKG